MTPLWKKILDAAKANSFRRNLSLTFIRQILVAIIQLIIVIIIARELGPEVNGYYAMAVFVPAFLTNILSLGIGSATVYYTSKKHFNVVNALKGNLLLGGYIGGSGVLIGALVIFLAGNDIFPGIPKPLLLMALMSFPVSLMTGLLNAIFQGVEEFERFNLTTIIPPVILLVGVVFTFYIFDLGVYSVLGVFIFSQLCSLIIVTFLLKAYLAKSSGEVHQNFKGLRYNKTILSYGVRAHMSNIITFLNYRADLFLVNFMLSPAAAGVYIIAIKISEKLWMPSKAISTVIYPRLSSIVNNSEKRFLLAKKGFLVVSLVTLFTSFFAIAFLAFFIEYLFGKEYSDVFTVFIFLVPGIVLWAGARIQSNCIAAAGKPEWNMYVALIVFVINITGNILLIPDFGLVGAASATSVAYISDSIMKLILVRRTRKVSGN
jgi:O-antigen/teichoic acid export membrane protein